MTKHAVARHITRLTDPAGLAPAPAAPAIFNEDAHRNPGTILAMRPEGKPASRRLLLLLPSGRHVEINDPAGPTDDNLIATQVAVGMPRQAAEQVRHSGAARFLALRMWCDVQEAAGGDADAKLRVDYYRESFEQLRRAELIAEDPRRTTPMA